MSNFSDYSQILNEAYEQFLLPVYGKKVPMPYRINIPPNEHPARQGKSSPEVILKQLNEDALDQNFDLQKASIEEIGKFMKKNNLGIDCSGFAYRMLDFLVQKVKGKNLESFGLPNVGRTNVNILTSDEFSVPINSFSEAKPGDIIKFENTNIKGIPHCAIILDNQDGVIIYAHSSDQNMKNGVQQGTIKSNISPSDLSKSLYNTQEGTELRKLKIFVF